MALNAKNTVKNGDNFSLKLYTVRNMLLNFEKKYYESIF